MIFGLVFAILFKKNSGTAWHKKDKFYYVYQLLWVIFLFLRIGRIHAFTEIRISQPK
jgi:hypothetical protein